MIELHVFTNCVHKEMNTDLIDATIKSFSDTFGMPAELHIWLDNKPAGSAGGAYETALRKTYDNVHVSEGLSDGYIKSIQAGKSDYLFMLEHDWAFLPENIHHNYNEIVDFMKDQKIDHLRFNKSNNIVRGWNNWLEETGTDTFKVCRVLMRSNNPHFLNRKHYLDLIDKEVIQVQSGSKGVEERFWKHPEYHAYLYGELRHPATLRHLDGRGAKEILKKRLNSLKEA